MAAFIDTIATILVFGLAYAMLLFIISVGLSITMGLMGFVNLAHGAFAMVGGYLTVTLVTGQGVGFIPALIVAFVVVALGSIAFERVLYQPLYKRPELDQVLMTIGLVFVSVAAVTFVWGPDPQLIQVPDFLKGTVDLGFKQIPL